ncbi:MAG: GNAT family N-acetyltransferase, partial [Sphaerochaetaceae bacterium]
MVVATPLTHISLETLTQVFNAAFGNYEVPIHMEKEQLLSHTKTLGVSQKDSIGLFDKETLIGFLLVARKGTIAYDAGTGIIPEYQGNGYAHHLIEFTLEHLRGRGVTSFILEVIDTNKRAKNLYISHGFSTMRSLRCYQVNKDLLQGESSVQLRPQKNLLIPV